MSCVRLDSERRISEMGDSSGDRTRFFSAIEKKHGGPIAKWIAEVKALGDSKYADQISLLQKQFNFSRTHANAVVMYVRGSTTSKRFASPKEYFSSIDSAAAATAQEIFTAITKTNPKLELVTAWNQPVLKSDKGYVLGVSASKQHLTINPFSKNVIDEFADDLKDLGVGKHTFKVPIGWKVNAGLLRKIVRARLAELD